MLRWILSGYPIESIWQLKDSFTAKRHDVGGRKVSLDDIEHGTLRPLIGYRAHAVLVCAARSCPPLQRFAYTPGKFLNADLGQYSPALGAAQRLGNGNYHFDVGLLSDLLDVAAAVSGARSVGTRGAVVAALVPVPVIAADLRALSMLIANHTTTR